VNERTDCGTLLAFRHRGTTASGKVRFDGDLRFFEGHFPGEPIFPGAAQILLLQDLVGRALGCDVRLADVRRVKFKGRIEPGAQVSFRIEIDEASGRVRYLFSERRRDISSGTVRFER